MDAKRLVHSELSECVIGAFYETYNALGHGFLESVYEKAFALQLGLGGLHVESQRDIVVRYRGHVVGEFRADLIIEGRLLVEIKAVSNLIAAHEAQLINYLKATNIHLGLLFNFGPKPQFRRRIL